MAVPKALAPHQWCFGDDPQGLGGTMSSLLFGAIVFALACYVVAMALCLLRLVRGPSAQDRVLAMDLICTIAMLVLLVLAIRYRNSAYFEAALLISIFGFVSAAAMAKFLLRGEVIE